MSVVANNPIGGDKIIFRHPLWVRICHWVNAISILALLISGILIFISHAALYWGPVGYFGHESAWLTILDKPVSGMSLIGRPYHFLFAWVFVINGLLYLLLGLLGGHLYRKMLPSKEQWRWSHIVQDIVDHFRLKTAQGAEALKYNFLQKISYLIIIFVLCPLMLISGLSMSPGFVAVMPELLDFFGGRQSGRS
ncbi:MAG: cytochrome b/b6 domain-containing protein, partial [Pseudomonadales bacterium]